MQRGGHPSCMDRVLASRVGVAAIEALMAGHNHEMIGITNNEISYTPFEGAIKHTTDIDGNLLWIVDILSL